MAVTPSEPAQLGESSGSRSRDEVLGRIADTNTFDCDWPTLRTHLHDALDDVVGVFASRGPPRSTARPTSPSVPGPSSLSTLAEKDDDKPPAESLLLSPSTPTIPLDPITPSTSTGLEPCSVDVEPSRSPQDVEENGHPELRPSTEGGLVIPPFPPLDPSRKRKPTSTSVMPMTSPRANGHMRQAANPLEDDWDEDVVIGGKKLPGWMDEEEAESELERVGKLLDNLDCAPFTIQRIAELLLNPTQRHTSLGKFLRALEKALLVNTPWEAPSYTYVPPQANSGNGAFTTIRSSSSASSDAGSDEDSLMPPGASTPMFSPIPFLRHDDLGEPIAMDLDGPATNGRTLEDGLMSPLRLDGSDNGSNGEPFRFEESPSIRSPTPEPDDQTLESSGRSSSPSDAMTTPEQSRPSGPSDPGHQSYLGRVDELDTGPLSSPAGNGEGSGNGADEVMTPGAGEGGNMAPHGMSDKPVPISSTTVVNEEDRKIAGMPRGGLGDRFVKGEDAVKPTEEPSVEEQDSK